MKTYLTNQGIALYQQVHDGGSLIFTKAAFGAGFWTTGDENALQAEIATATELRSEKLSGITFDEIDLSVENLVKLTASFSNNNLTSGFHVTEVGFFAKGGESQEEVLYAICATDLSTAAYVPPKDERVAQFDYACYIYIGDAANVSAVLSQISEYASETALTDHIEKRDNPHEVTKEQVGLSEVPNVSTNNQAPTFTQAETFSNIDGSASETDATRGKENLSTLFGKIKKAIAVFWEHLQRVGDAQRATRRGNPHGTTAEDVGAASLKHYHSAGDINDGVMKVKYGGTGLSKGADFAATEKFDAYNTSHSYCRGATELPGGLLVQWGWINVDGHTFECNFKRTFADTNYALIFPSCGDTFIPVWKNPTKRTNGFTMKRTFGVDSTAANLGVNLLGRQLAKFIAIISSAASIRSLSDVISWFGELKDAGSASSNNITTVFGASQAADWIAIGKAG